ncbi:MAG TPA: TauD/TfdA family dioxygenase [Stellaceae bacterium]|jgi:taurine dioxygenase|nr:TauD/TfdA family dioxygenase [Stellaceae bacterium]
MPDSDFFGGLARGQRAARQPNTLAKLKIVPTGRAVGAEIRGVDLSQPVPADVAAALRNAWLDHLVLLFRDQYLDAAHYLDAARIFGDTVEGGARRYMKAAGMTLDEQFPELTILSNLDESGQPVRDNGGLGSYEVVWHSDNSYVEAPPAGSCLYSLEVPTHSGNTSFNNQYVAYETLPADLKQAITGKRSKQDASRNSAGVLRPGLKVPERPDEVPGPMHPLVRVHPDSGRTALYLGRRRVYPSQFIEGFDEAESEAILARLWEHATREELSWTHRWKAGDFLVWDNRCAMHYREEVDDTQRRVMFRTQFAGQVPIAA